MDKVRQEAWEDFLDMTIAQALTWAAQNIAPEVTPSEIVLAEPYIMGVALGRGWRLGQRPEDLSPPEYFWGYNKMTSIQGLFAAGDGVGAAPHKFSSGSFTEGRLAAKPRCGISLTTPRLPPSATALFANSRTRSGHRWRRLRHIRRLPPPRR